jgi:Opioid growth factor receptor (OGFr) conserved region
MQTRLISSLSLMLDFYGMAIDNSNSLLINRHRDPHIWRKQYNNLETSYHNYLRITRIFKCLCELGQGDYVPSILLFILAEQSENGELDNRELKSSMDRYWVYCMREKQAQACVANAVKWVRNGDGEFTMSLYRKIVKRKQTEGTWRFDLQGQRPGGKDKDKRGRNKGFFERILGT